MVDASLGQALQAARQQVGSTAAELLFCGALSCSRTFLFTYPEHVLPEDKAATLRAWLERHEAGEPLAYILGKRAFFGHEFRVTPDVLIPRPDTELLVSTVLDLLPQEKDIRVADLGTGSGAIAISLALARPAWQVMATDLSAAALAVAAANQRQLGADNVRFLESDWFARLEGRFQAIVSNPPYIAPDDGHLNQGDLPAEPRAALVAAHDGLGAIRQIIHDAPGFLETNGLLAIEHGWNQGALVREIFATVAFTNIQTLRDLAGHERVTLAWWP